MMKIHFDHPGGAIGRHWDVVKLEAKETLEEDINNFFVSSVTYRPDGKQLASGGSRVRFWDIDTSIYECQYKLREDHKSGAHIVIYRPDGKQLASGGEVICLWDVVTWQKAKADP